MAANLELTGRTTRIFSWPLARVGGDTAKMHPASVVLDEYQYVQPVHQHGACVKEADGEDSGGLGAEELPPGQAFSAGCGTGTRGAQDLLDGGRRDGQAQLGELAMNMAVSPERVLLGRADGEPGDAGDRRRAAGPATPAGVIPPAASLRCQASSVAGVTGKTPARRRRGMNRMSALNQARPAGSYRTGRRSGPAPRSRAGAPAARAFFAGSPRKTRTARLNSQRMIRNAILSSTWPASYPSARPAGEADQAKDVIEFPGGTGSGAVTLTAPAGSASEIAAVLRSLASRLDGAEEGSGLAGR
jgi:hypothetical protein